jgi:K+ transporter
VNESAASAEAGILDGGREAPQSFVALALGSVGVVYGNIGTSPLL